MINNLEIFLKEAVGRGYGISTSKLIQKNTVKRVNGKEQPLSKVKTVQSNHEDDLEESKNNFERVFVEEDRTFFCSELIAKAYKVLGVIEDD